MIYKFKLDDVIFSKLKHWIKDKSETYNEKLAGNIRDEFGLDKYKKEFEPYIINVVKNIEPLRTYFLELDVLWPNDQPLVLKSLWVNFQKKYEFNPIHKHGGLFSFIIFIQIPYTSEEQSAAAPGNKSNDDVAGKLSFVYPDGNNKGGISTQVVDADKSWEGTGLIFKAHLRHCVYPFYTEGERITISGNLYFGNEKT